MENSWQDQCGSSWQGSLPPSQFPVPENRNQVITGEYLQSYPAQCFNSIAHAMNQEHLSRGPSVPNYASGTTAYGSSFLSLLSTPPQQLQWDSLQTSITKTSTGASVVQSMKNCTNGSGSISNSSARYGQPEVRTTPMPHALPPGPIHSVSPGTFSLPNDTTQEGGGQFQLFQMSKQSLCPSFTIINSDGVNVTQFGGISSNSWFAASGKAKQIEGCKDGKSTSGAPCFSINDISSTSQGKLRVFCCASSGVLVTERGHFGIMCICHGQRMSVAKFCEHAGSYGITPGVAVYTENGESLVMWRKKYFLNLGVAIPDDDVGWGLPDRSISLAPSLDRKACSLQNQEKLSIDLQYDSAPGKCGISVQSSFPSNNSSPGSFTGGPAMGQFPDGFVTGPPQDKHSGVDSSATILFPLNASGVSDETLRLSSTSSKGSKLLNSEYQSIAEYINFISNGGCQIGPMPSADNSRSGNKEVTLDKSLNMSGSALVNDGLLSSNIDLRLGQPSRQVYACSSLSKSMSSQLSNEFAQNQRFQAHNGIDAAAINPRLYVDSQQSLPCAVPSSSTSKEARLENQFFHCMNSSGSFNTLENSMRSVSRAPAPFFGPRNEGSMVQYISHIAATARDSANYFGPHVWRNVEDVHLSNHVLVADKGENLKRNHVEPNREPRVLDEVSKSYVSLSTSNAPQIQPSFLVPSSCLPACGSRNTSGATNTHSVVPLSHSINPLLVSRSSPFPMTFGTTISCTESNLISKSHPVLTNSGKLVGLKQKNGPHPHNIDEDLRSTTLKNAVGACKGGQENLNSVISNNHEQVCSHVKATDMVENETKMKGDCLSTLTDYLGVSEAPLRPLQTCRFSTHCPRCNCSSWSSLPGASRGIVLSPGVCSVHSKELNGPTQTCCCGHVTCQQFCARDWRPGSGSVTNDERLRCCQDEMRTHFSSTFSCMCRMHCFTGSCCSMIRFPVDNALQNYSKLVSPVEQSCISPRKQVNDLHHTRKQSGHKPTEMKYSCDQSLGSSKYVKEATHVRCSEGLAEVINEDKNDEYAACVATLTHTNDFSQENAVTKEQQMSNAISEGSGPVVTEFSVEDRGTSFGASVGDGMNSKMVCGMIVDEGSGVQTSFSTDEELGISRHAETSSIVHEIDRKVPAVSALSTGGLNDISDELQQKNRIVRKRQKDKLFRVTGNGIDDQIVSKFKVDETTWKWTGPGWSHLCSHQSSGLKRKRSAHPCPSTMESKKCTCPLRCVHHDTLGCSKFEHDSCIPVQESLSSLSKIKSEYRCKADSRNHSRGSKKSRVNGLYSQRTMGCLNSVAVYSSGDANLSFKKSKPVVIGNSGIISNGEVSEGFIRPPKILSLISILKRIDKRVAVENGNSKMSTDKISKDITSQNPILKVRSKKCTSPLIGVSKSILVDPVRARLDGSRIRKRTLLEISVVSKNAAKADDETSYQSSMIEKDQASPKVVGTLSSSSDVGSRKILKLETLGVSSNSHLKKELVDGKKDGLLTTNCKKFLKQSKSLQVVKDSDPSCSVCGTADSDPHNKILKCSRCYIKVHQACYGVRRLPKGEWSCRPCKTSLNNIVCVICGYEGGAMTRALRSQTITNSLLKAWKRKKKANRTNAKSRTKMEHRKGSIADEAAGDRQLTAKNDRTKFVKVAETTKFPNSMHTSLTSACSKVEYAVNNTITQSIVDPTTMQWVHMVCALWTPGTKCPNVDTMNAFDVSGVAGFKKMVCSMCKRPGGSCIRCRVADCGVVFHPWCAHRKGLLQSEAEGTNNENVGFYGICLSHSGPGSCQIDMVQQTETVTSHPLVPVTLHAPGKDRCICSRTEGYKGRKKDGFLHDAHGDSITGKGHLVPQEQIYAWAHINGLRSRTKVAPKPQIASDVEFDCRKEYARYKQWKGWKNLVVFKSGIHGLGLYTSQFITRGAMVVEYVGEIVGLRVADKREIEYHSGRRLQYESACYFFRIDRENIIDATRKGGIARFVNHSCLPNCVAKILSVRNEKKVVFFAERAINPGEEITYDYHFNHEDEGQKIPCLCKSKNCRRFLN